MSTKYKKRSKGSKANLPDFNRPKYIVKSGNWQLTMLDRSFYIKTLSEPHFPIIRVVAGTSPDHAVDMAIYPDGRVGIFEMMPTKAFINKFGSDNIQPDFAKELLESYIDYAETKVVFPNALRHLQREAADIVSQ